ncbi:hypothetical protein B0T19DRAFT_402713 [Cercophora scortea]|uniref:Uncharacterized protein n=1 Tax=Cercophora scortea TaxID=314031 RepID=A0AAE0MAF5_9PEZI|nr:hypothetical protein B0T19DRAFT_402713 [Cercophora scortea]
MAQPTVDQRVRLNYIQWKEEFKAEKPYEVISEIPEGNKRRNFSLEAGPEEVIQDMRGSHLTQTPSRATIFHQSEVFFKKLIQEPRFIYLTGVSVDPISIYAFDARSLFLSLFMQFTMHTIEDFPLAVCDGSTVPSEKLLAVDHVRKYHIGESLYPLYCETSRWYYLNGQGRDEVLLFKTFDSSTKAAAKCCPHTSFHQQQSAPLGHSRETIEVRALVFSRNRMFGD